MLTANFSASWFQHTTGLDWPFRDFWQVNSTTEVSHLKARRQALEYQKQSVINCWILWGKNMTSISQGQFSGKGFSYKLLSAHSLQQLEIKCFCLIKVIMVESAMSPNTVLNKWCLISIIPMYLSDSYSPNELH